MMVPWPYAAAGVGITAILALAMDLFYCATLEGPPQVVRSVIGLNLLRDFVLLAGLVVQKRDEPE